MSAQEVKEIHPKDRKEWRKWLEEKHDKEKSVWLIYEKKQGGNRALSWAEAVEEALCFGWIDSKAVTIDEQFYMQFFTRRKPGSVWSKINKDKVEVLMAQGLMAPAGLKSIEVAKENGSWSALDAIEELTVDEDLAKAFTANPGSAEFFESLSKSVKKMMLYWVSSAKRTETKEKRVLEIAQLAAKGEVPKQFPYKPKADSQKPKA